MKTAKDLMNITLNTEAIVSKSSYYFKTENKVIRFSDHKANYVNFCNNNSEVTDILLIQICESEENFDSYVEEIENTTGANVSLITYTCEEDEALIKLMIEKFLK